VRGAVALCLLVAGIALLQGLRGTSDDDAADSARSITQPAPPEGPVVQDGYAGVAVCRRCHEAETRAWERSPHGRQATPRAEPAGGSSGAVGSQWMQAYLRRDARGYHRILPRCYDLRKKTWRSVTAVLEDIRGPMPGAPPITEASVATRSFDLGCSGCHASGARLRLDVVRGQLDSSWRSLAIDCEACHGPGRAHSEAWANLDSGAPPRGRQLVRLETLSPRARTGLCARCHGGPEAAGDYAPSDAADFVGLLEESGRLRPDGSPLGQMYQYVSFIRSPCHLKGGLTCDGCHAAHGPGLRYGPQRDGLCVRCHEAQAGRAHSGHVPDAPGGRCLDCHMPRLREGLTAHQRDHRIGIPLPASPHVPDACTHCHQAKDATKDKAWAARAWRRQWGAPPAATLEAISAIARARDGDFKAAEDLRRALQHPDPYYRVAAAKWLGDAAAVAADPLPEVRVVAVRIALLAEARDILRRLRHDESVRVRALAFEALLALDGAATTGSEAAVDLIADARQRRRAAVLRRALGEAARKAGRIPVAVRFLEEALVFDPENAARWEALAAVYEAAGRRAEALASWARAGTLGHEPGGAKR